METNKKKEYMLRKQVSLLKYKEQIFKIALELHKYNSQSLFLSSLSHNLATANQKPQTSSWRLASDYNLRPIDVHAAFMSHQTFSIPTTTTKKNTNQNHPEPRWTKIINIFGIIT